MSKPVSISRHQAVIDAFYEAIKIDDMREQAFDDWVNSGREGDAPEVADVTGDLTLKYMGLGMAVDQVVTLREAAYQMAEEADATGEIHE